MKRVKKLLVIFIVISLIGVAVTNYKKDSVSATNLQNSPLKVAVFLIDFQDDFISLIKKELENIQRQSPGQIEYTFYDAKDDQGIQNGQINKVLNDGVDLILLNIVKRAYAETTINRIKEYNVPVILFDREPLTPTPIQAYNKAIYIGTDSSEAGRLQGKMIVDAWNTSKSFIDKNRDDVMQYVMLQGESDNTEAIERTKYSIKTIENAGITTQQIALEICDWREDVAYNTTKQLFSEYGDKIEVIIANDDSMAIGAIKALQEQGYNNGNKLKTIPVVGVDIIPQAKELIERGQMLGSVHQDPKAYAEALYAVGMNLVARRSPVENTNYQLNGTRVAIRLPHKDYLYKNIFIE